MKKLFRIKIEYELFIVAETSEKAEELFNQHREEDTGAICKFTQNLIEIDEIDAEELLENDDEETPTESRGEGITGDIDNPQMGELHNVAPVKDETDEKIEEEKNPAHFCLSCDKYIGIKGFCSEECHDEWYDKVYNQEEIEENHIKECEKCGKEFISFNEDAICSRCINIDMDDRNDDNEAPVGCY